MSGDSTFRCAPSVAPVNIAFGVETTLKRA